MGSGSANPLPSKPRHTLDPEHLDHQIGDPRPRVLLVRVGFDRPAQRRQSRAAISAMRLPGEAGDPQPLVCFGMALI